MKNDKLRTVAYWVSTGLLAFALLGGGFANASGAPAAQEGLRHLGFPPYLALLLGTWKIAGALAILAPRLPRLKEWAYAGVFFNMTGAAFSHAAAGDPAGQVAPPLFFAALAVASWALRPAARKLAAPVGDGTRAHGGQPALAAG